MFRLMRNVHLWLGLAFVLMAMIFAVSSLFSIYKPYIETKAEESEIQVRIPPEAASTPRAAARALMAEHDLAGDLRQIQQQDGKVKFRIVRPGESADVEYTAATGEGLVKRRRQGVLDTLMQLHTNHGLWHEYFPANAWSMIALLTSLGLLLLGLSGIYLWFVHNEERRIGTVLLGFSLIFGLVCLIMVRMQGFEG
ncbi:MAG: PepSY-associated TM helix domain-containing protein [Bryobacterales bacterium]|nr:PepSY-associated TM helix domain-containing protein [Bryobacterales bacterium]